MLGRYIETIGHCGGCNSVVTFGFLNGPQDQVDRLLGPGLVGNNAVVK